MDLNQHLTALSLVHQAYKKSLRFSESALDYLRGRILETSIYSFGIGFCDSRTCASQHLLKEFTPEEIQSLGIFSFSDGIVYDRFNGRLIFPVNSAKGDTLGFVARELAPSPFKYLNTEDNIAFKRSELFFGLDIAIPHIIEKNFVFVCEGLFDVIAMHEAGFKNTVASLGSSLTSTQLKTLKCFTDSVIIVFDGDAAGQTGASAAIRLASSLGLNAKSILFPIFDDPSSLYNSIGVDAFRSFILNRL